MKRTFMLLACVAALTVPSLSLAQSTPEPDEASVLADVNLSNASIVKNDGKTLVVSFDIENRSVSTQSDIRYGIEFIRTTDKGQEIVDTFVASETLSLSGNQSAHKELSYPIQSFLSGDFEVWTVARTTGGLVLGHGNAGKVTFSQASARVAIVPGSCHLKVSGDDADYALSQGVDISKDESLSLVCTLRDESPETLVPMSPLSLTPYFDTYRRSIYGEPVPMKYPASEVIPLARHETKIVSIDIPKASDPQAYDVSVIFRKSDGTTVSEKIIAHYVLRGVSATIQNVSLDKVSYAKGDAVNATLFVTPSADGFPDSRAGEETDVSGLQASFSVTDSKGRSCVEPQTKTVEGYSMELLFSAPSLIDCDTPTASVILSDANGAVLDSRLSDVIGTGAPVTEGESLFFAKTFAVALIVFLFVVSLGLIVWKRLGRGKGISGLSRVFIFAFVLSGSFFFGSGKAEAVTWTASNRYYCGVCDGNREIKCVMTNSCTYGSWDWASSSWVGGGWTYMHRETAVSFTANTDKTTYVSGENIVISGSAVWTLCGNSHSTSLRAYADFGSTTVFDYVSHNFIGSSSLIAPTVSTPTTYTIRLLGDTVESYEPGPDDGNRWTGTASVTITVLPPVVSTLHLCVNGAELSTTALVFGDTRSLRTYYGPDDSGTACSTTGGNTDVTASTAFTESGQDAVTLSGNGTSSVSVFAKNPDTGPGRQTVTEVLSATYPDSPSKTLSVSVSETCSLDCAAEASRYCTDESWSMSDSCGVSKTCSAGTKNCSQNWKEAAPGE